MSVSRQPRTTLQTGTLQGSLLKHKLSSGWWTHPMLWSQKSSVQSMSSLQSRGVWTHPVAGSQVSVVHAFMSSQSTGLQAKVVVVVMLVVELVVVPTTATRSATQSSTSPCRVGESVVLSQSFGALAWSFAKQPLAGSTPPVYFATALSTQPFVFGSVGFPGVWDTLR